MPRQRMYYLGRVQKLGELSEASLVRALQSATTIEANNYAWTFTDVVLGGNVSSPEYVFGYLSKFRPEGVVRAVDRERGIREEHPEPDLLVESSPFVYVPAFSGIAYQHVWNAIEREVFARRFKDLVEGAFDRFFVGCGIEPIADLRSFVARLRALEKITEISAKVHPPNPLFGRAWKDLRDYLRRRATAELAVREKGTENTPIRTAVLQHLMGLLEQTDSIPYEPGEPVDLPDAALLMAMDGYGRGAVHGLEGSASVTIRTGEMQKSFRFDASPSARELYEEARRVLEGVNRERDLGHV